MDRVASRQGGKTLCLFLGHLGIWIIKGEMSLNNFSFDTKNMNGQSGVSKFSLCFGD